MSSTPYDRQSSFAAYSAENPGEPHSGATLDAEFNAVKVAIDDTQQNLALIQDDDGELKRGIVGQEHFDSSVSIGFGAPSQWAAGQIYTEDVDTVFYQSKFYIANTTHTSTASFEAANWDEVADFTLAAVIEDGSITSAKLADAAVNASKLADGSISSTKIATGAVATAKLADEAVTEAKLGAAAVTADKIGASAVATAKIEDDAVTYAKMQNVAASRLLGNPTGGTASPSEISLGQGLSFDSTTLKAFASAAHFFGFISGLTLSTAGSSSTMSVAVGSASDSGGGGLIALTATMAKTTASWQAGTGNGGIDTGSIANSTWYHWFVIGNPTTGAVDALFSLSPTAPTMPSGYTLKRWIGAGKTNGSGQWTFFRQYGDEIVWDVPVQDVNAAVPGATALHTLASVPTGVSVMARLNAELVASGQNSTLLLQSGGNTSGSAGTPVGNETMRTQVSGAVSAQVNLITNTSAQIRSQGNGTNSPTFYVVTTGFRIFR